MIPLIGKMATFGGPNDKGVAPDEGLALFTSIEQCPNIFLQTQPTGTTGLARRLNPAARYVACRWDYKKTPVVFLRSASVTVTNPANGIKVNAQPADYGPNTGTRRVACLSPGLATALGLATDEVCEVQIPEPLDVLVTQAPLVKSPSILPSPTLVTRTAINFTPKLVDLSHYDDLQDIQKVKAAGILGVVNKVSEGPGMVDATYAIRKPVVLGAGLRYGGYHFLRPGNMAQQATHFLNTMGDVTGMMLWGDWEVPDVTVEMAREWFGAVHDKIGRWPRLYNYSDLLVQFFGTKKIDTVLNQCLLCLAAYNNHPLWPTQMWSYPDILQFTGDGNGNGPHTIPGIVLPGSRGIDINAYEGGDAHYATHTDAELLANWDK